MEKPREVIPLPRFFSYRDDRLYAHHTLDEVPVPESFSMHAHEWLEVYYFISGRGSYLVEGTLYPLQPHDIFILRPSESHKLVIEPDAPYERIAIHFSPQLLESLDPDQSLLRPFFDRPLGQHNRYPAQEDPEGQLRAAFSGFSFDHVSHVQLGLTARLILFLLALNGLYEQRLVPSPDQGLPGRVVTYVNEHLFEPISLQSVADTFYRSRSQISRIFRQATGSSLWEYVRIKRLLAARAMIQRGESAGAACMACGFSEYSSFFRAYRAHFGHSPREDSP